MSYGLGLTVNDTPPCDAPCTLQADGSTFCPCNQQVTDTVNPCRAKPGYVMGPGGNCVRIAVDPAPNYKPLYRPIINVQPAPAAPAQSTTQTPPWVWLAGGVVLIYLLTKK